MLRQINFSDKSEKIIDQKFILSLQFILILSHWNKGLKLPSPMINQALFWLALIMSTERGKNILDNQKIQ